MQLRGINKLITDEEFNELLDKSVDYSKKNKQCLILCFKTGFASETERIVVDLEHTLYANEYQLAKIGKQVAKDMTMKDGDFWGGLIAVVLISNALHFVEGGSESGREITVCSGMTSDKIRTNLAIIDADGSLSLYVPYKPNRKKYKEKENSLRAFMDGYVEELIAIFLREERR